MSIRFKSYHQSNYNEVCQFLVRISQHAKKSINWNWARWEWMYFHQDFDMKMVNNIGLWYDENQLIAVATYDYYNGESAILVDERYKFLYDEIIGYAIKTFSDEEGLGIAVNDEDHELAQKLQEHGFKAGENEENILVKDLSGDLEYTLGDEFTIKNIQGIEDVQKYNEVLWKGMDHEGDLPTDTKTIQAMERMLSAQHINYHLNVYINYQDTWGAFCSCWYMLGTDYAYIEPVCTLPEYRHKGIGKAAVYECLMRCKKQGAKQAFVISDMAFYKKLGFTQYTHYTFYWKK